jgi:signal transduction histidine kinase
MSHENSSLKVEVESEALETDPSPRLPKREPPPLQLTALERLSEEAVGVDPSLFWERVVACIAKQTGADIVLLFEHKEEGQVWSPVSSCGLPNNFGKKEPVSRAWQSLPTIISHEGGTLFSEDITKDRRFVGQMIRGTAVRSFAGATLQTETATLGSLSIGLNSPEALTEEERAFFLSLSKWIGPLLIQRGTAPSQGQNKPITMPESKVPVTLTPVSETPASVAPASAAPVSDTPASGSLAPQTSASETPAALASPVLAPVPPRPTLVAPVTPVLPAVQTNVHVPPGKVTPDTPQVPSTNGGGVASQPTGDRVKANLLEGLLSALISVFQQEDFSKEVLKKITLFMEADIGYLLRWDKQHERLFPVASTGVSPEMVKRIERSGIKADMAWGKAIDRGQSLLLSFDNWKSPMKKKLCGEEKYKSMITVPVHSADETWGFLSLFHRTHAFSPKELKLVEFAGEKVSAALNAVRQWDAVSTKIETLTLAQRFGLAITNGVSDITALLNEIKDIVRASNAYLLLYDEKKSLIKGLASSSPPPPSILEVEIRMEDNTICPLTVKQNRPLVVDNAPSDSRVGSKWIDWFRSRSLFSVPLIVKSRVIGVLLVDETAYFRKFTPEEIQTVVDLSHPFALSVDTAIQYQEALRQRERQETLSIATLRLHEDERRKTVAELTQGVGETLEKARRGIQEARTILSTAILPDNPAWKHLEESGAVIDNAAATIKTVLSGLELDRLEKQGLLSALQECTQRFSKQTGTAVKLSAPPSLKRGTPSVELILYRIVQEALSNVSKHAVAKSVSLSIDNKEAYWQLSITDDGKGFDAKKYFSSFHVKRNGMGISGMRARVELAGGIFFIESEPHHGTRISIKIPITKNESL